MQTKTPRFFSIRLSTIALVALALLGVAGVARLLGGLPNPTGDVGRMLAIKVLSTTSAEPVDTELPLAFRETRSQRRCPECGVIVSMRETLAWGPGESRGAATPYSAGNRNGARATSVREIELTVRLEGGSHRVIAGADPASWRPGERVIVIDGTKPPRQ